MIEHLAWPTCAFLLGVIALTMFRQPLKSMLERVQGASKDGLTFGGQQQGAQVPAAEPLAVSAAAPATPALTPRDLLTTPMSQTAFDVEALIGRQLAELQIAPDAAVQVLQRALAIAKLENEFNEVSRVLYGSQLGLLARMSMTPQPMPRAEVMHGFEKAKSDFPAVHADAGEAWLSFLVDQQHLIAPVQGDSFSITQRGKDLLKHMVERQLMYNRAG